jgi:hypothetical protein
MPMRHRAGTVRSEHDRSRTRKDIDVQTMTATRSWADPSETTDPADRAAGVRRSPINVATFGTGELRTVIVDDGDGPRLHLQARTEDGLDLEQATALLEVLTEQVETLRLAAGK